MNVVFTKGTIADPSLKRFTKQKAVNRVALSTHQTLGRQASGTMIFRGRGTAREDPFMIFLTIFFSSVFASTSQADKQATLHLTTKSDIAHTASILRS